MLKNKEDSKILIVFSDPGGAKPCLSIASELSDKNFMVVSDRNYSFYQDFGIDVKVLQNLNELNEIITSFMPSLILTGTSYTSSIEKKTIADAKRRGIKVLSFIDHWTSMLGRFRDDEGTVTFPDGIYVIDQNAKNLAVEEGIPLELLNIYPNPYHSWLKKWKPKVIKEDFINSLQISHSKKIALFAPDPLSNIDGVATYGYDELTALKILLVLIESSITLKEDYHFLFKPHPNQKLEDIEETLRHQSNFDILPQSIDANESIFFSNCIVGFFSSILIEADLMGKKVIRFIPKTSLKDPFRSLNLGVVANEDNLLEEILKLD